MDTEQLSEIITQVLKRMNIEESKKIEKKKALLVLEDVQNGFSILKDYKQLIEGYDVSSLTAQNITGLVEADSFERTFMIGDLPPDCDIWIKQFELVLIPNPSLKVVSKIAHVILDDKFTELIFSALQEKKQVLIGQALDNEKAINFTGALRTEIQRLTDKLKDYGIQQLPAKKDIKNCCPNTKAIIDKTRRVISMDDVSFMTGNGNVLSISAGTIITPLAMDYIREKKISINRIN